MIQLHVNVILKIQVPFQEQYIYIYMKRHTLINIVPEDLQQQ